MIKIIECPRDAMQGLAEFIPTDEKAAYINQLLKVGFDTIDFGSFVAPKVIPQMRDTKEVLSKLDVSSTKTKLLAIVANKRGGEEACTLDKVNYIGFPLSVSETFQVRNTNQSIEEALKTLNDLINISDKARKELVVFISMAFGNPYQDRYDPDIVLKLVGVVNSMGIQVISLADTIGISNPLQIQYLFQALTQEYHNMELGVHLHSHPATAKDKVQAAYQAGCKRFDGALLGFGGCPMADDELVGNIDTGAILSLLAENGNASLVNGAELQKALMMAENIFSSMNRH